MKKRTFTGFIIASAILYGFVLYNMLFAGFNRAPVLMSEHMKLNYVYSLIPFATIGDYVTAVFDGSMRGHAIRNLAGNLLLLVPLGFYLPFFVRKTANIKIYSAIVAAFIMIIEITQMITFTGSFDVDDFILNFAGAMIGILVCKYTPMRSLFSLRAY